MIKRDRKEYMKEYRMRPEVKKRRNKYLREYRQRPEVKEHLKKYRQRPEEYRKQRKLWESLSDKEQLEVINRMSKEILKDLEDGKIKQAENNR